MDKDKCITNLRDLIKPSNTDDENEALLFAIESVRASDHNWKFYYNHGYKQAKSECKKCEYRKFTQTFIDRVVVVMKKYGITSVEQLSKMLKGGAE